MGLEDSIDMAEIKEKLTNLRDYMPNQDETVYEFGRLLSEKLGPRLVPEGFNMVAELLLYDLNEGVDGYSKEPIKGKLAGMPSQVYALLGMYVDQIAEAVCPEDFSQGLKKVRADLREMSSPDFDSQR